MHAWIQTWIAANVRQDRIVMRLSNPDATLRVRLPVGAKFASAKAAIDGQTAETVSHERVLIVSVPPHVRGRSCVFELFYTLDPPPGRLGWFNAELKAAEIQDSAPPRRLYWQLVLPNDLQLITLPGDLASEMVWSFDRGLFIRRPVLDQRQLEAWAQGSRQDLLPRGVHTYLFGTLARWPTLSATVWSRRLLVGLASGFVLCVGLVVINVSFLRPAATLVLAVMLGGLALASPDLAIVLLEGSALGLAIALALGAFIWLRSTREMVFRPRAEWPASLSSPSTQLPVVRRDRSSQVTATAPVGGAMEVRP
jgi:hypothetical protein